MSDSVNTRELILDILMEVTEHQGYSHIILRDVLNKYAYRQHYEHVSKNYPQRKAQQRNRQPRKPAAAYR